MAARKAAAASKEVKTIEIKPPNFKVLEVLIAGTAPYVSNRFEFKDMYDAQLAGEAGKDKKAKKPPKDFDAGYRASMHRDQKGNIGYQPCVAYKAALVRAGYDLGVDMTRSKTALFVLPDAFSEEGSGLVRIIKGTPERFDAYVRNSNGSADIRARGRWPAGWEVLLRVRYDADLMQEETVANLVHRAGVTIGIGAGRPFSKMSVGQDWGTFESKQAGAKRMKGAA